MVPPAPAFPVQFGPYLLVSRLGEGGMAQVFRAVREGPMGFRKELAVKRIKTDLTRDNQTLVRALINEARLGGQLRHPNIVDTYEFGSVGDQHYIAMEYVQGLTLHALIAGARHRGVRLPVSVGLDVCAQVCDGLDYASSLEAPDGTPLELVHRDLKPANIIVATAGQAKIMDFGIARTATALYRTTATDVAKGTLQYMSPEQLQDPQSVDHRSDLFAVGSILFEVLTGEPLMSGPTMENVMWRIVSGEYLADLDEVDAVLPEALPVVRRCTARERDDRYQSARELATALRTLRAELGDTRGCRELMELVEALHHEDVERLEGAKAAISSGNLRVATDTGWSTFVQSLDDADDDPEQPDPFRHGMQAQLSSNTIETHPRSSVSGTGQAQVTVAWRAEDEPFGTEPAAAPGGPEGRSRSRSGLALAGLALGLVAAVIAVAAVDPLGWFDTDEPGQLEVAEPAFPEEQQAAGASHDERATPTAVFHSAGEPPTAAGEPPTGAAEEGPTTEPPTAGSEPTLPEAPSTPEEAPTPPELPSADEVVAEPPAASAGPRVRVVVNTDPWSSWTLSGDAAGAGANTPYVGELPPGTYRFELRREGDQESHSLTVVVPADDPAEIVRCWSFRKNGPC